jgi:hypothetical protein
MTDPKMVRCPGSGRKVDGPDENDGTVQCRVCGKSFLPMETTTTADGKHEFSVSEHTRRASPPRPKGGGGAAPRGRASRRDSGTRR